jgi:hypothetical protein
MKVYVAGAGLSKVIGYPFGAGLLDEETNGNPLIEEHPSTSRQIGNYL